MTRKFGIILILLFLVFLRGYSQKSVVISGKIKDTTGVNLSKPTIQLITTKDTINQVGGEDGSFQFLIHNEESCRLLISMNGYYSFSDTITIPPGSNSIKLPPIALAPKFGELAAVTVVGIKPLVIKEDTLEYNAAAYTMRAGSELNDLLKRLPGIETDTGGNLLILGRTISRIMIDGQGYSGGSVAQALNSLPADIIDKVEVIDDYGDKARLTGVKSGEPIKAINIILKKDKKHGELLNGEAGAGNDSRYNGALISNSFQGDKQYTISGQLSNLSQSGNDYQKLMYVGYSDKLSSKWSGSMGASIGGENQSAQSSMNQSNIFSDGLLESSQNNQVQNTSRINSFPISLTFKPNANYLLRISNSVYTSDGQSLNATDLSSQQQDSSYTKATEGKLTNHSTQSTRSIGSTLYFEKINPHDKSRFSLSLSYQYTSDQTNASIQSNTKTQIDSLNGIASENYLSTSKNHSISLSGIINYYLPVKENSFVELEYSYQQALSQTNQEVQGSDSANMPLTLIDSLSYQYIFRNIKHQFHAGYLSHTKKLNYNLGLNWQSIVLGEETLGKQTNQNFMYYAILPQAELNYNLSQFHRLHFEYLGQLTPPSMNQLQPFTNISNPQYPVEGNAALKPSYTHSLTLNYEQYSISPDKFHDFQFGLDYGLTNDMITTNLIHPQDTSDVVQKTTFLNVNGYHKIGTHYRVHLPNFVNSNLQISISGSLTAFQSENMVDNQTYRTNSIRWDQGLQFTLLLPNQMEATLGSWYSQVLAHYTGTTIPNTISSQAGLTLNGRNYLFKKWVIQYDVNKAFFNENNGPFQGNPTVLNASFERELFSGNQVSVGIFAYDLLNQSTAITESISPSSISQSKSYLIGRYFLFSIKIKLERFKK